MSNETSSNGSVDLERLARLSSALIGDVLEELGYRNQIFNSAIGGIAPGMRVAGPAFCVRGAVDGDVASSGHEPDPSFELFRHMYDGCVAVVSTGGYDIAGPWGENTALSARVRGCCGAVIDGGTRDAEALVAMSFPVFARFATPARVEGRWRHIDFETPVPIRGQTDVSVVVSPGDLIVGDTDGVVALPADLGAVVVEAAEELERIEVKMRKDLVAGVDREIVYRQHDRYAHIRRLRQ